MSAARKPTENYYSKLSLQHKCSFLMRYNLDITFPPGESDCFLDEGHYEDLICKPNERNQAVRPVMPGPSHCVLHSRFKNKTS